MKPFIKEYTFSIIGLKQIKIKAQSQKLAKLKLLDELFFTGIIVMESMETDTFIEFENGSMVKSMGNVEDNIRSKVHILEEF